MLLPLKDEKPTRSFPAVTIALIAANIAVFLYQNSLGYSREIHDFIFRFGAIPYEITRFRDIGVPNIIPAPLTILSAMFIHGGIAHLAGNMLYLWIFGNNIEDVLGRGRFFIFYILCGIIAGIAQIIISTATASTIYQRLKIGKIRFGASSSWGICGES